MRPIKRLLVGLSLLATCSLAVATGYDMDMMIKYRQNSMKAAGAHLKSISAIVRGKLPLDEHLLQHAHALRVSLQEIPKSFPADSELSATESDANPEIWVNWPEFQRLSQKNLEDINALILLLEKKERPTIDRALKQVAASCRACHKHYRD